MERESKRATKSLAEQNYFVIVIKDKSKMKKIYGCGGVSLPVFWVDFIRIIDAAGQLGHDFGILDLVRFVAGNTDTMLAVKTASIDSKSLGPVKSEPSFPLGWLTGIEVIHRRSTID